MKIADKAYIAGFFDGEGSISIRKQNVKYYSVSYYPSVSIVNTHKPVIKYIQNFYGGVLSLHSQYETRRRVKKLWKLIFRLKELKKLLTDLHDYLFIKKVQSEIVLEFLKIPRGCKNGYHGYIQRLSKEQIKERRLLYRRYKKAQKVGKSAMPGFTNIKTW
jgi:LAGLIDADG endonuclease